MMQEPTKGVAGVLAWCNSIRFNMAKDPGRQFLDEQIQSSFDFLDSYLENVLSGPKTESVTELLKTPGRRKNAPVRTRAATAAAAGAKAVIAMSLEENDLEHENRVPVNTFHKVLLQAKEANNEVSNVANLPPPPERPSSDVLPSATTTIEPDETESMSTDGLASPTFSIQVEDVTVVAHETPMESTSRNDDLLFEDLPALRPEPAIKELSMIAEDDESAERSRLSGRLPSPGIVEDTDTQPQPPSESNANMEVDSSAQNEMTSTSVNTFHSIPLDSPPRPHSETVPSLPSDHQWTEPLPKIAHEPMSEDDVHAMTAPLPIVPSHTTGAHLHELSVPIRDGPSASVSAPSLASKTSLSQMGLPAPSPLHKSTRLVREPSMGTGLVAGSAPGGKRSSWLVKAREAKAMEATHKRTSSALNGPQGSLTALGTKRKSREMFVGIQGATAGSSGAMSRLAHEEDRATKLAKFADTSEDVMGEKVKLKSPEPTERGGFPKTDSDLHTLSLHPIPSLPHQLPSTSTSPVEDIAVPVRTSDGDGEMLDRFKRTVEGLGARAGKSMGKSLGGNAAAALAEARAAAEARVAQRNKAEGAEDEGQSESAGPSGKDEHHEGIPQVSRAHQPPAPSAEPRPLPREDMERRLTVSDLVPGHDKKKQFVEFMVQPHSTSSSNSNIADASTSTTPPNSPPSRNISTNAPAPIPPPVFSKPQSVFAPPPAVASDSQPARTGLTAGPSKDFSFKLPTSTPFSLPAAITLGVPASFPTSPSQHERQLLSAQSSKASLFSDTIFDKDDSIPAWMPTTQDTDFSIQPSQSQPKVGSQLNDDDDDDDSWHVDDKFTSNHMWTPFGFASADKDDTWSTLPSRSTSQKGGDTGPVPTQEFGRYFGQPDDVVNAEAGPSVKNDPAQGAAPGPFGFGMKIVESDEADIADQAMDIDSAEDELQSEIDYIAMTGKSTVSLVQSKTETDSARSQSQQSMASTASSSQSQLGFFGHASKLVSSVLGGSKKTKPEPVKSLQLAAQAAKKQGEEIERKAARLKEMENRRQLALQRKTEADKVRALEEERKVKEENERRKREREEHTDKRPIKITSKADEDNTKKRKLATEVEKKVETKKPPSKDKKDVLPQRIVKPGTSAAATPTIKIGPPPKSALKQPITSTGVTTGGTTEAKSSKPIKPVPSSSNLKATAGATTKGKGKAPSKEDDEVQTANRVEARVQAAKTPLVTSESIELPDINSEYSDSEDEDRPRTFDPPEWAQSPELRQALQQQSTMNPDDIFGRIGPLRMEEIFRTRQSRFRARTSSANWTGTDQLTAEEEREYARRMGFK